jgi:hypothetical protein
MDKARRKQIRYKIKDTPFVTYWIKDDYSRSAKCDIINVSNRGVCVRVNAIYDLKQEIVIRIVNTADLHEIFGKVVWKNDNYYGLFLEDDILNIVEFDRNKKYLGI